MEREIDGAEHKWSVAYLAVGTFHPCQSGKRQGVARQMEQEGRQLEVQGGGFLHRFCVLGKHR